jgi:hypothetical protein
MVWGRESFRKLQVNWSYLLSVLFIPLSLFLHLRLLSFSLFHHPLSLPFTVSVAYWIYRHKCWHVLRGYKYQHISSSRVMLKIRSRAAMSGASLKKSHYWASSLLWRPAATIVRNNQWETSSCFYVSWTRRLRKLIKFQVLPSIQKIWGLVDLDWKGLQPCKKKEINPEAVWDCCRLHVRFGPVSCCRN